MPLSKRLLKRFAVYCPNCKNELNVYSTFSLMQFALKCNVCNQGYVYERDTKSLEPSDITDKIEEQWKHDAYHQYYQGVPTSQQFMPRILKKYLFRTK